MSDLKSEKMPFEFALSVGLNVLSITQPELAPVSIGLQNLIQQLNAYSEENSQKMNSLQTYLESFQQQLDALQNKVEEYSAK